jgi:lysophospholipase L1-like esterase
VQENGTLVTLSGYTASDYMAVLPGDTIKTTPARDGAWYDGNKTYISGIVSGTATALTLTAPANAKFMRITFENAYVDTAMVTKNTLPGSYVPYTAPSMQITDQSFKDALNQNTNAYLTNNNLLQPSKWKNKVWSVIGDSITEVNAKTTKNYHGYIKDKINCTVNNYGLSGTGWIVPYTTGPAFYNRTSNVDINSDLITVFGGTNDWGRTDANTFPFGALGDTTSATFYGAVDLTLSNLINRFPTKMIAVILPLPRVGGYSANSRGETLDQYANAIKEVANKYCIPVLDLYRESNFYVRNSTFNSTFMPDGLHPNDAGHQLIADKILAFLNAL